MFKQSAKQTVLFLAFLALAPVCNGAFAQSVTGGDPVPGPRTSATATGSPMTAMSSIVMVFLLALQGA